MCLVPVQISNLYHAMLPFFLLFESLFSPFRHVACYWHFSNCSCRMNYTFSEILLDHYQKPPLTTKASAFNSYTMYVVSPRGETLNYAPQKALIVWNFVTTRRLLSPLCNVLNLLNDINMSSNRIIYRREGEAAKYANKLTFELFNSIFTDCSAVFKVEG
jgi:hypothetical protein